VKYSIGILKAMLLGCLFYLFEEFIHFQSAVYMISAWDSGQGQAAGASLP
jgi:hypothetical protein